MSSAAAVRSTDLVGPLGEISKQHLSGNVNRLSHLCVSILGNEGTSSDSLC